MSRKSTKGTSPGDKRAEMRGLERELYKAGFRVPFWKRYGRRITKGLTILLLLAGIVWCAKWILVNYVLSYDIFAVRHLEFSSNGIIDERQVLEIMGYDSGVNMISLDADAMEKRLLDCTAVRTARVNRHFPSTLSVDVDLRVPVAWVNCPGAGVRAYDEVNGLFVDSESAVFKPLGDAYAGYATIPSLSVPTPADGRINPGKRMEALSKGVELIQELKKEAGKDDAKMRVVIPRNDWSYSVEFDDDSRAVFGVYDIRRQAVNFYLAVANARKNGKKIEFINMMPERNIPVKYSQEYEKIPVAEPVQ